MRFRKTEPSSATPDEIDQSLRDQGFTPAEHQDGRISGILKRLIPERGFGFIYAQKTNKDYFLHFSEVENATWESLKEGDELRFVPDDQNPKGPRASSAVVVRPSDKLPIREI